MERKEQIDELLKQASTLNSVAIERFYTALFSTEFFVPTREGSIVESTDPQTGATEAKIIPARDPSKEGLAMIGASGNEGHDFATFTTDGKRFVPFFGSLENLRAWLGPAAAFRSLSIEKILWSVKGQTWLYLEPNQDYGKEFSPWEIEQLRRGPEAVPDLVSDQLEDRPKEVEFSQDTSLHPEFRARLRTMFEVFDQIEEAFLLSVGEENSNSANVLVGVRQTDLPADKQKYLNEEIDFARAAALPDRVSAAVMFDLNDANSANSKLFQGAVPFYIRQEKIGKSNVSKFGSLVSGLFGRKAPMERE